MALTTKQLQKPIAMGNEASRLMPAVVNQGANLMSTEQQRALALQKGTMSATDLPEFARAQGMQRTGAERSLADVATKMNELGVSGASAAAVMNRAREGKDAGTLQLAQGFGDMAQGKIQQGIGYGMEGLKAGLSASEIAANRYSSLMQYKAAIESAAIGANKDGGGFDWGSMFGGMAGDALSSVAGKGLSELLKRF